MSKTEMPKVFVPIKKELDRWLTRSRSLRTSAGIAYGKIKSQLSLFESTASPEEIVKLQSEIGKKILKVP